MSLLRDCEVAMPALDESYYQSQPDCILVAVRLMGIVRLAETQRLYYSKTHWGKSDHSSVVYMASEIYAKIYGLPPVLCSKYLLKEVSG